MYPYTFYHVQEFVQEYTLLIPLQQDDHDDIDSKEIQALLTKLDKAQVEKKKQRVRAYKVFLVPHSNPLLKNLRS